MGGKIRALKNNVCTGLRANQFTLTPLTLLLILVFTLIGCEENRSLPDERPIEFTLNGHGEDVHFRIPKHYFEYPPYSDQVKKFMLEVRLPGFVPEKVASYEEEPISVHDRERASESTRRTLQMTITAGFHYSAKKGQESGILPGILKETMTFEEKYGLYDLGQNPIDEHGRSGRTYNRLQSGEIIQIGNRVREYYVPKENFGKEAMYIGCSILASPRNICFMHKDIGPNIRVVIRFSYSRLADWRDLNQQITSFITSFIIPNRENEKKGN